MQKIIIWVGKNEAFVELVKLTKKYYCLKGKIQKKMVVSTDKKTVGVISQVIGPVVDVAFPPGQMPNIYNALVIKGTSASGDSSFGVLPPLRTLLRILFLKFFLSFPVKNSKIL